MSARQTQLFLGFFILVAFISIGVFGLFQFSHSTEAPMDNCPYTQNNSSLCANSLNHINDWQQFSSTPTSSFFIFSLLILGIILYFFAKEHFLNQKQYFYRWRYFLDNKKFYASQNRIIRWLSLLENSPAF